jgi:hypothetical protein
MCLDVLGMHGEVEEVWSGSSACWFDRSPHTRRPVDVACLGQRGCMLTRVGSWLYHARNPRTRVAGVSCMRFPPPSVLLLVRGPPRRTPAFPPGSTGPATVPPSVPLPLR